MGLEPTTLCMANARSRSRPFAPVRSNELFAGVLVQMSEHERTRANAEPCHSCHGFRRRTRTRRAASRRHVDDRRSFRARLEIRFDASLDSRHSPSPTTGATRRRYMPGVAVSARTRELHTSGAPRSNSATDGRNRLREADRYRTAWRLSRYRPRGRSLRLRHQSLRTLRTCSARSATSTDGRRSFPHHRS
jgi:hypothetical protein